MADDFNTAVLDEVLQALIHTVEYVGTETLPPIDGWSWFDVLKKYAPQSAAEWEKQYQEQGARKGEGESNLVKHARYELELLGEEPEMIEGYLRVIQAFADMGHSGGSAMAAVPVINDLLQFKNLKPLTDNPDEWINHAPEMWDGEHGVWQNKRNGEAFSNNGGKTYYLLSEVRQPLFERGDPIKPIHKSEPHKLLEDEND